MASRSVTRVMTLPLGTLATLGTSVSLHVLYSFLFSLFIYFLNIYFPRNWQSYKVPNVPKVPIIRGARAGRFGIWQQAAEQIAQHRATR